MAFRETHGEHVIGCSREERRPTRVCTHVGGELDHVVARAYCFDAMLHRKERESIYVYVKLGEEDWERHVMRKRELEVENVRKRTYGTI